MIVNDKKSFELIAFFSCILEIELVLNGRLNKSLIITCKKGEFENSPKHF